MSVVTPDSKWPLLVGAAPLGLLFVLLCAAMEGDADVMASAAVPAAMAVLAALGAGVAWRTARELRAEPALSVARASALARIGQLGGVVAMRGHARALPEATPLISPCGELCLWFRHGDQPAQRGLAGGSVRPFLLVDDSGECIVLPAGADVNGGGRPCAPSAAQALAGRDAPPAAAPSASAAARRPAERLLRDGDRIHVVGRFVAISSVATSLPVIGAPGGAQPFVISIAGEDDQGVLYRLLAIVDALLLLGAGGLSLWALLPAR